MRSCIPIAQQWERDNASPNLFGGKGMGAQRAAYVAAFQAEQAALSNDDYAMVLLDLVKAFERIPHAHLFAHGRQLGYNLILLGLSLAAYRLERRVSIGGVVSVGCFAREVSRLVHLRYHRA